MQKSKEPWHRSFFRIEERCKNKNGTSYHRYGGKGIKNLLTVEDLKFLWIRDKAYNLECPSIDRIDASDDYKISNCRWIERRANCSMKRTNKLNFEIAQEIREKVLGGTSKKSLARKYGINPSTVLQICKNIVYARNWKAEITTNRG